MRLLSILKKVFKIICYRAEWLRFIREIKYKRMQNRNMKSLKKDSKNNNLILFLVPGADVNTGKEQVTGGLISILSIYEETVKINDVHHANCCLVTLRDHPLLLYYSKIANDTPVFRFSQFSREFDNVNNLLIHVPEYLVYEFEKSLTSRDQLWLSKANFLHCNILNQNIRLMPSIDHIVKIKRIFNHVTISTAHKNYCNLEFRLFYSVPLHWLSVWITPEIYNYQQWILKEDLIVVSPDSHPLKELVIQALTANTNFNVVEIKNISYDEYKLLISKAKWSITFGEGLDGYFIEPIFSGAIGIAVYNKDFFTYDFLKLPMIYSTWDELLHSIVNDILIIEKSGRVKEIQYAQFNLCSKYYNSSKYKKNILNFYLKKYTYG